MTDRVTKLLAVVVYAAWAGMANATPITDTVTVGNTEWAQVDLFQTISWLYINAVCPGGVCGAGTLGGYTMTGWTWASLQDMNAFFNTFLADAGVTGGDLLGPTDSDFFSAPNDSAWATAIFSLFRPTEVHSDLRFLIGNSASVDTSLDRPYQPAILDSFSAPPTRTDVANTVHVGAYDEIGTTGAWFYRTAVPVPSTLALLGLGLAGHGFSRRRKTSL